MVQLYLITLLVDYMYKIFNLPM